MKSDKKHIGIIILIYILLFLFFYFFKSNNENTFVNQLSQSPDTEVQIENEEVLIEEEEEIFIHISGEVNYPGLIKLSKGQRLYEAIDIAGGMTEKADLNQINLSLVLNDQDKVYIPSKDENVNFIQTNSTPLININTASKEELMTLSGIGEKTANSIIEYREKNGFNKIEDIMNVPGIGEQKFLQIQEHINI